MFVTTGKLVRLLSIFYALAVFVTAQNKLYAITEPEHKVFKPITYIFSTRLPSYEDLFRYRSRILDKEEQDLKTSTEVLKKLDRLIQMAKTNIKAIEQAKYNNVESEVTIRSLILEIKQSIKDLSSFLSQNLLNKEHYTQLKIALEEALTILEEFEKNIFYPRVAEEAFDIPHIPGSYISSRGHFLSTMHWSGDLLNKQKPPFIAVVLDEIVNKKPITGFRVDPQCRTNLSEENIGLTGVDEVNLLGKGFFSNWHPSIATEETLPLLEDYVIARQSRPGPYPCLPLAAALPAKGEVVYVMTARGPIAGSFFPHMDSFIEYHRLNPKALYKEQDPVSKERVLNNSDTFIYVEGPFKPGDSSGALVNSAGELLGVLASGFSIPLKDGSYKTVSGFISAQHIQREARRELGDESTNEIFNCSRDN